jgi:hypothetical protein
LGPRIRCGRQKMSSLRTTASKEMNFDSTEESILDFDSHVRHQL